MATDDDDEKKESLAHDRIERRRRVRRHKSSSLASSVEVSPLLLFLLGGLAFCVLDLLYISRYISVQQTDTAAIRSLSVPRKTTRTNRIRKLPTDWNASSIRNLVRDALGTTSTPDDLPDPDQVSALYGSEPRVWGLDSCQAFQNSGDDPASHFITTAGTFNTGTNLMAELLIANCYMPERRAKLKQDGVRWQAVWGKHTPVWNETVRLTHRTYNDSMCRHSYGVEWTYTPDHCPNLLLPNNTVTIHYAAFTQMHRSLVHFFNEFYADYMDAKFPRLIVRMEDLMFHPVQVTQTVCECAGGKLKHTPDKFKYVVSSAKKGAAHGTHKTSYTDAMIKYGTEATRYNSLDATDLAFAKANLDPDLMEWFGYKYAQEGG